MFFSSWNRYRDVGSLVLRVGFGLMFLYHGAPKILGGPATWEKLGMAMGNLGIGFFPTFWGLISALTEFGGGICLLLGLALRPICVFLTFNMIVASIMVLKTKGLFAAAHPIEVGIVFLSLILIGPGRYSLDEMNKEGVWALFGKGKK